MPRLVTALAAVTLLLGGCALSSQKVAFTNVSDTWVNVRVYVSTPDAETGAPSEFVSDTRMQIRPGDTAKYPLTTHDNFVAEGGSIVHIQVEPVGPSWNASGIEYWLELLTPPPVNIVATGSGDTMTFNTGDGAVAVIPDQELKNGRFDHKMVSVPESDTPE